MACLLLHFVTLVALLISMTMPSITLAISFHDPNFESVTTDQNQNKLIFNPYNQYTVDQLLIKMPSVLEEPEPSDSEISSKILDVSNKNEQNQNVFKLHLKSLLDSLTFNNSKSIQNTTISIDNNYTSTPITDDDLFLNETITENNLIFNDNNNNNITDSSLLKQANDILSIENRKKQQEVNLLAQSRYKSVKHILSQIHFNCTGREEGYYADPDFDCHIFHYCKENGFKFTFICPANTIFSQEELQCDSSSINSKNLCRSSENFYFINSLIYKHNSSNKILTNFQNNIDRHDYFDLYRLKQNNHIDRNSKNNDFDKKNENISKFSFSNSKWNGIELTSPPKKIYKDSIIYTPKGDLPGFRSLISTTQMPLVQQIDTPRWFPPPNATSDILNKFDKDGFNVYNNNINNNIQSSTVLNATTEMAPLKNITNNENKEIVNKYSLMNSVMVASNKRPFLKVKGKPPKRTKIPNVQDNNTSKSTSKPIKIKMKPAYSIQWDDDDDIPMMESSKEPNINDKNSESSNLQHITISPNSNNHPLANENTYLFTRKPIDSTFNPFIIDSQNISPIEFDEIFNKIPLRPLQTSAAIHTNPEDAYQHMLDHLRQRPPPAVIAALAREQLKPLRMMINNLLVSGSGNSIAKRHFLITPPQEHHRPFVPETKNRKNNKLVKRSDRFLFGLPINYGTTFKKTPTRKRFISKLRRLWRPIAKRLNL